MFESALSLTRAVDEIVWAVNLTNDTLHRLFMFLAHDVEELARSGGLALTIRVDELGGSLAIDSAPGRGIRVAVQVPLAAAASGAALAAALDGG